MPRASTQIAKLVVPLGLVVFVFVSLFPVSQPRACGYTGEPENTRAMSLIWSRLLGVTPKNPNQPARGSQGAMLAALLDHIQLRPWDEENRKVYTKQIANVAAWQRYLGNKDARQIRRLVYYNYGRSLTTNPLLAGRPKALAYLQFAKRIQRSPRSTYANLATQAARAARRTRDNFLRERYALQAVRLAGLSGNQKRCLQLYRRLFRTKAGRGHVSSRGASLARYWAMGYAARAHLLSNQKRRALQLYSSIFSGSPGLRWTALQSIRRLAPQERVWRKMAARISSLEGRQMMWLLAHVISGRPDDTDPLKEIVTLDANSKIAAFVALSTLKKLEPTYLTIDRKKRPRTAVPARVAAFFQKVLPQVRNAKQRKLWLMATAYAHFLARRPAVARRFLAQAGGGQDALGHTINLVQTVIDLSQNRPRPGQLVAAISFASRPTTPQRLQETFFRALGRYYLGRRDVLRAAAAYRKARFTNTARRELVDRSTDAQLAAAIGVISAPRNAVDRALFSRLHYTKNMLQLIRGKKAIRQSKYQLAVRLLSALPTHFAKRHRISVSRTLARRYLRAHKRAVRYFDRPFKRHGHYRVDYKTITLLELARMLAKLQRQTRLRGTLTAARAHFALGNLFFSLPGRQYPIDFDTAEKAMIGTHARAKRHYLAAMRSQDRELAARALVMHTLLSKPMNAHAYRLFRKHARRLSSARYLRSYAATCPTLRAFVGSGAVRRRAPAARYPR
jgi:hypothetical protein